jgi:hypothetical protein
VLVTVAIVAISCMGGKSSGSASSGGPVRFPFSSSFFPSLANLDLSPQGQQSIVVNPSSAPTSVAPRPVQSLGRPSRRNRAAYAAVRDEGLAGEDSSEMSASSDDEKKDYAAMARTASTRSRASSRSGRRSSRVAEGEGEQDNLGRRLSRSGSRSRATC